MKTDFRNWDLYTESSSHVLLCACSPLLARGLITPGKSMNWFLLRGPLGPWSGMSMLRTWLLSLQSYWITAGPEHIQLCPHCLNMSSFWKMGLLWDTMTESRVTLDIHFNVVVLLGTVVRPTSLPGLAHARTAGSVCWAAFPRGRNTSIVDNGRMFVHVTSPLSSYQISPYSLT